MHQKAQQQGYVVNQLTGDSPISGAGDSQIIAFDLPSAVQTERCQPDAIHRVVARLAAVSSEFQIVMEIWIQHGDLGHAHGGVGPLKSFVEAPCTTGNGEVSRGVMLGRQNWNPRR